MVGKYIHDSSVINDAFDCHYINLTTARDLSDIGRIGLRKLRQFVGLLQHIHKEVKRLRPEFVYVTPNACGGAFYKDFIVVQMLKCMGCKVVVHYHNKGVATRQDRRFDDFLYRRFFNGLKVILLAEPLYDDVAKYVSSDDVYICPNGIPDTLYLNAVADKNNEVPRLLFLSNLLESKGVQVLLDALKILREKGCRFVCDFVGGETAEMDTRCFSDEIESRGLNGLVVYHGRKYGNEKENIWLLKDIVNGDYQYDDEDLLKMISLVSQSNLLFYLVDVNKFDRLAEMKRVVTKFASKIDIINMNNIPLKRTLILYQMGCKRSILPNTIPHVVVFLSDDAIRTQQVQGI